MRLRPLLSAVAVVAGLVAVPSLAAPTAAEDLTALVNPLAGSLGPGFVTVAAGQPFGMVTPGPITTTPAGDDPVNYVGYGYQDPEVRGFAITHFSGAGIHIGGELPFMPTTGAVTSSDPGQWASPVSHATETARPGYYSTTLSRYQTTAELTATPRVAVERFTFPSTMQSNLLLDVSRDNDAVQNGALQIDDDRTVRGSVTVPGSGGVTMWFTARFDQPFTAHGTWLGSTLTPDGSQVSGTGAGGWVTFDTTTDPVVGVRVSLSYVDPAGADGNLTDEAPDGTAFDAVAAAAKRTWNDRLHAIDVTGGAQGQRATFYTNLYHALLMPDVFDDADGRYLGFDGVVHAVEPGHHHYTDLSLWDTYRTQTPLLTLAAPDVAHDLGISLLDDTDQNGGVIPKWVRGNRDYSIMGGDSGTPTLATLVTDGALTGAEAQRAYAAVLHQARTAAGPRDDLGDYLRLGYIPYDHSDRGAAVTLEYAIDDAAVAALATPYGTPDEVAEFRARAESWKNLFDADGTRFLRPRHADGSWASPTPFGEAPTWDPVFSDGWQEGTGWQYLWLVPQDVAGLRDTLGVDTMQQRLDEFFSTPAQSEAAPVAPLAQTQGSFFGVYYVGNQYTPANETDLQAPWLYDWLGEPAKTAQVVHAGAQVFSTSPYGLPGNDDAGTMSAAYVLASIGIYQAQPGVDAWELSTPMFDSVVVNGASGPRVSISAAGAGPTMEYVASAALGSRPVHTTWLDNEDLTAGQPLTYVLSPVATSWATAASSTPPSISDQHGAGSKKPAGQHRP
jgi:predicted alpha-1,2-mannosidase